MQNAINDLQYFSKNVAQVADPKNAVGRDNNILEKLVIWRLHPQRHKGLKGRTPSLLAIFKIFIKNNAF